MLTFIKNNFSYYLFIVAIFFVVSCQKKKTITPVSTNNSATTTSGTTGSATTGWAAGSTSGSNPNSTTTGSNSTATGTVAITNPASENSGLTVGGNGWSSPSCASSNSLTLKAVNGTIEVTLTFSSPPVTGKYNISSISGPTNVQVSVLNPPNQPTGVIWYAKTGVININATSTSINATFTGIVCVQANFNFPIVTMDGSVGCN